MMPTFKQPLTTALNFAHTPPQYALLLVHTA
jgi:hypothetical protein